MNLKSLKKFLLKKYTYIKERKMRKNLDLSLYQSTSASTYSHILVDDRRSS